jgi:hypothetical protein
MSFYRAFQWYHSNADPIWLDGTFKIRANLPYRVGHADILHRLGTSCISRQAYQPIVSNISKKYGYFVVELSKHTVYGS